VGRSRLITPLVGGNDVGDDAVTNHVASIQMYEGEIIDSTEHRLQPGQPTSTARQIHLCGVSRHDDL